MLFAGSDNNFIAPHVETFQFAWTIFLWHVIVDNNILFACHLHFILRFFSKFVCVMIYLYFIMSKDL